MKFILSFLILSSILSADTCFKLSVGNAALTPEALCSQSGTLAPSTSIDCKPVTHQIPTQATIKCDLPTTKPTSAPLVARCTSAPVECPKPQPPTIPTGPQCPGTPSEPHSSSATPEPASYALLGAGLMTAGIARRFRNKKVR